MLHKCFIGGSRKDYGSEGWGFEFSWAHHRSNDKGAVGFRQPPLFCHFGEVLFSAGGSRDRFGLGVVHGSRLQQAHDL